MIVQSQPRPNIWLLEDDPGCQFLYEDILGLKYDLEFFNDLGTFVEKLESNKPNLLIADLRLPGQSFIEFLRQQGMKNRDSKVIVISANDDQDIIRECFDLGVCDYLAKPFHPSEIRVKIERTLFEVAKTSERWSVKIDIASGVVTTGIGECSNLTLKELKIINAFMGSDRYIQKKSHIFRNVWGNVRVSSKTLDVHFSNIRPKLRTIGLDIVARPLSHYQLVSLESPPEAFH